MKRGKGFTFEVLPPDDGMEYVVIDAGNSHIKAMDIKTRNEIVIPHAVLLESAGVFSLRRGRMNTGMGMIETVAFQFDDDEGGVVVGKQAHSHPYAIKATGIEKYMRERHMNNLIAAALLMLFPDRTGKVPVNIHLAYPPGADTQAEAVFDSMARRGSDGALRASYRLTTLEGNKVTFVIKNRTAWEEPQGGTYQFLASALSGVYRTSPVRPGQRLLIADIGGGVTSIMGVILHSMERFEIESAASDYVQVGVNDVRSLLARELRSRYPKLFPELTVDPDILDEALQSPQSVWVRGNPENLADAVDAAVSILVNSMTTLYRKRNTQSVSGIIVTGGGGALLFDHLTAHVFTEHANAQRVFTATERRFLQRANMRGAAWAWAVAMRELVTA